MLTPLPPTSPTHRQQISQEGDSYSVAVKIATKSELVKTMIDEDEDDADEVQEVPLPNVKSSVLTKVIEFLKHDDAEPMSEIDKPLKSSNMSEVVQVRREGGREGKTKGKRTMKRAMTIRRRRRLRRR